MIRAIAACLLLPPALACCGQKGDLRLPAAQGQAGTASAQPVPPAPASTPAPPSHK